MLLKLKILLVVISLFSFNNTEVVHRDTPLKLDGKGNIIGLPKQYKNPKFIVKDKKLSINNKTVIFPECLQQFFKSKEYYEIDLSASWYHYKDVIPYYLNFSISSDLAEYSYSILIDLDTLELISVSKNYMEGNRFYNPEIKLEKQCLSEYKSRIKNIE
ncbi:hypothetical protein [uncultured Tenacibaculum sp.]|uniref:hypothetical protein n=1 Tax=uncultured Tenacibaculum sp. TaxID=174713 RepID=UPI00262D11D9|nr:hypothetical protein [uncultured Tenacibaculum sp.]